MVIHADRWAAAFINTLGGNAGGTFARLKELSLLLKPFASALFGSTASQRLEKILRENYAEPAPVDEKAAGIEQEYSIRFICLLVEKKVFHKADLIIEKIEKRLDEQNGVLEVIAETALPVNSAFEDELSGMIQKRTGAAQVKTRFRLVPELLAGYRLRIGGLRVDASLKGQLEKMAADLTMIGRAAES